MRHHIFLWTLIASIIFNPTLPWVFPIQAATETQPNWFSLDVLDRITPSEVESFVENIQENMRYQSPEDYARNIQNMAEIYKRYERGDSAITFQHLQVLDEVFTQIRTDYIRDANKIEVNRLLYGLLSIQMAALFSASALFKDGTAKWRNSGYLKLHAQAVEKIGARIEQLQTDIQNLEKTLLIYQRSGSKVEERAIRNLRRPNNFPNLLGKKNMKQLNAEWINAERLRLYGKRVTKRQQNTEKQIIANLKKLRIEQNTLTNIGTSDAVLGRTQVRRRLPLNTFPKGGNLLDFLIGYIPTAGPWAVSREVAPAGIQRNVSLIFKKIKETPNVDPNAVRELENELINLQRPAGVIPIAPSYLIGLQKRIEKIANALDRNIVKDAKKSQDWAKVYMYDRLVWNGGIYLGSLFAVGYGYATLKQAKKPQNWWLPVTNTFIPFERPLRQDPKVLMESYVPGFYTKYVARFQNLFSAVTEDKQKKLLTTLEDFSAHENRVQEVNAFARLELQARRDLLRDVPSNGKPLLPQPKPGEEKMWLAAAVEEL